MQREHTELAAQTSDVKKRKKEKVASFLPNAALLSRVFFLSFSFVLLLLRPVIILKNEQTPKWTC